MGNLDETALETVAQGLRGFRRYARLEVEGLDRLPPGPFILVANHTGWTGLDYALLWLVLRDDARRSAHCALHPAYFRLPGVRSWAHRLGFFEVSVGRSLELLDRGDVVAFFPEGEDGNFKPMTSRYELQAFKPGFARVALAARRPVVPAVVIGGEDANPSLARIDATKATLGHALPVPLNLVPFPVKWRIAFLPPLDPRDVLETAEPDEDVAARFANELRDSMQDAVREQLERRGNPIF